LPFTVTDADKPKLLPAIVNDEPPDVDALLRGDTLVTTGAP
jgi:hypothetical protein